MTPNELLALEIAFETEFEAAAKANDEPHDVITDGAVDAAQYLSSRPRILWILKEPWEEFGDGERVGGWSVSKQVASEPLATTRGALPVMAYIAYSIFNGFPAYDDMDWATSPAVSSALHRLSILNVRKFPRGKGKPSPGSEIATYHEKYGHFLYRQIELLQPEVIIGGNTLPLFLPHFGLDFSAFTQHRGVWFCRHGERLLIHAYHPAMRGSRSIYVDDIVTIIRKNYFAGS